MAKKGVHIAVFEIEQWEQTYLKKNLPNCNFTFSDKTIDAASARTVSTAEVLCIFVGSTVTKKIIDALPQLKLIVTMSTGFDHIDIAACKKRNIRVANVPTYGENTVAEHTFALLLNISRRICESVERTRKGTFEYEGLRGFDLKGKTLGVIGTGRIGMHVVKIAKGFEMNVVAYDIYPNKTAARSHGFTYLKNINRVLSKSDIVTLHTPYTPKTHYLISRKNLSKFKHGAVLINTARGKLIETAALLAGLENSTFSAVGLDVLEEEAALKEEKQLLSKEFRKTFDLKTVLQEHALINHPRVFITPHNAFNSAEALQRILNTTIENINGFLRGKPINLVSKL